MIKCKKCNSTNIKVDYDRVLTSIPAKYEYECQDCGECGYINCDEAYNDYFGESLPKTNEDLNKPKEEPKAGLLGWICPKCGRCYSPYTSMCSFCNTNLGNMTWKITC